MKKYLKVVPLLSLFLSAPMVHAQDANVCAKIAEVVAYSAERYTQTQSSFESADFVCENSGDKTACTKALEEDYRDAKNSLEAARTNFHQAGCDNDAGEVL